MRRLLRGWRIRSHKAVTRARIEELGGAPAHRRLVALWLS